LLFEKGKEGKEGKERQERQENPMKLNQLDDPRIL
jgi:hypothetical protein